MAHKTIMQRLTTACLAGLMTAALTACGGLPAVPGENLVERPGRQSVQSHGENRAGR